MRSTANLSASAQEVFDNIGKLNDKRENWESEGDKYVLTRGLCMHVSSNCIKRVPHPLLGSPERHLNTSLNV